MRLSIDLWHTTVAAAVLTADGRVIPVAIDGAVVFTTGVSVNPAGQVYPGQPTTPDSQYVRLPGQRLLETQIAVEAATVDPLALLAPTIGRLAREALAGVSPDSVVISVPATWVTRQRDGVRAAASRVGLPAPTIVSTAESIVREQLHRGASVSDRAVVAVCRLDATLGELVLLRRRGDRLEEMAAIPLGEVGETPGATLVEQAANAVAEALDAANLSADEVVALYGQMPPEQLATLQAAVAVPTVQVGELTAAFGGARPAPAAASPTEPGRPSLVRGAATTLIAWAAAAVLTFQLFNSGTVYDGPEPLLITEWYAWGLVPVYILLGAAALALTAAGPRPGRSTYISVAAFGVVVGGAVGLFGATHFDVPPSLLLPWTLGATLPLAVIIGAFGLSRPSAASMDLQFPPLTLLLAAAAIEAIATPHLGIPYTDLELRWRLEHLGAFGVGWATALLVTSDPWRRTILGFLIAATTTYTIAIETETVICGGLIAAIALWWLVRILMLRTHGTAGVGMIQLKRSGDSLVQ